MRETWAFGRRSPTSSCSSMLTIKWLPASWQPCTRPSTNTSSSRRRRTRCFLTLRGPSARTGCRPRPSASRSSSTPASEWGVPTLSSPTESRKPSVAPSASLARPSAEWEDVRRSTTASGTCRCLSSSTSPGVVLAYLPGPLIRYRLQGSLRGLFRQTRRWGCYAARAHREFGRQVMPSRSARVAITEWTTAIQRLFTARSRAELAQCAVRFGWFVGRLQGSVRYRTLYL
jgi:hypothetical protein